MTTNCYSRWSLTQDQIYNIISTAMQANIPQYAGYAHKLQYPSEFIPIMLRDIADTSEENSL